MLKLSLTSVGRDGFQWVNSRRTVALEFPDHREGVTAPQVPASGPDGIDSGMLFIYTNRRNSYSNKAGDPDR